MSSAWYDAKWAALSDQLNQKRYVSFTENEKRVPLIFIVIYSAILLLLLLSAILG